RDAELVQAVAKPDAAALLEGDRDLLHGAVCWPELCDCIHEWAAAKIPGGEAPLQRIEGGEDLLGRRLVGGALSYEAALQIGRDQRVLGREVVVERALGDADLGRDGIDADSANALQIEQLVGGLED